MAKQDFHSKSFKEGIEILTDEIKLAIHWQRPSILLAIHKSKPEQIKAQQALEKEIIKGDQKVKLIKATGKTDVIDAICKTKNHNEIVFFVSELAVVDGQINGMIFSALNMHRELLVEQSIRVVFWLTEFESESLPHLAPDFWAFRHRVVEFSASRGTKKAARHG